MADPHLGTKLSKAVYGSYNQGNTQAVDGWLLVKVPEMEPQGSRKTQYLRTYALNVWSRLILGALIVLLIPVLTACASGVVNHAFSFDVISDSPGMQVLDYQYGDSKISTTRAIQSGPRPRGYGGAGVNGEMQRGDVLYVKWVVESTGRIYEDTVNLKSLLPRDISKHRIHFVVAGEQLFVYLITPDRRPPGVPINGLRKYDYLQVITLSSSNGREVTSPQ